MNTVRLNRCGLAQCALAAMLAALCWAWAGPALAQTGAQAGELELVKGKAKITRPSSTVVVDAAGARHALFVGDQRRYDVRTPTATVGVKGTEFYVGTDGETTYLLTVSGVVGMVNNAFARREVIAEAARASATRAREVPTPTIRVSQESLQRLQTEDGLQAFKDLPIRSESEKRQQGAQAQVETGLDVLRNTSQELRESSEADGGGFRYKFDFQ